MKPETQAIHGPQSFDPESGATRLPIHMTAAYQLPKFGIKLFEALNLEHERAVHVYTRWSNPTLRDLEIRLASLEGAEAGCTFATGMAAISSVLFGLLSGGDHIIASEVCYAVAVELLGLHLPRFGVEVSLVDTSILDQVRAAIKPNTRLIYIETPANPALLISDISAISMIARETGTLLIVDSTFASPLLQSPLKLGADLVIHSLTKYLNGHGDALGGIVLGKEDLVHRLRREMLVHLGGAMSPFNAWLITRGLETLPLRLARHSENALRIAEFLETHPAIDRVYYPGLTSHPHHTLAASQMSGFGGMVSFRLKRGLGAAINLAEKVKLFTYATSLGHPNSLLFYYPYDLYVEAAQYYSPENKSRIHEWIGDGLVRASIGLEDAADLIEDLDQALRSRTIKGVIGPMAYSILKKSSTKR